TRDRTRTGGDCSRGESKLPSVFFTDPDGSEGSQILTPGERVDKVKEEKKPQGSPHGSSIAVRTTLI
ncbi:hypothetical protein CHARACLAT_018416, partial [Characodon lateralis]|nr:hypothetical protein [Characodon lateralis]